MHPKTKLYLLNIAAYSIAIAVAVLTGYCLEGYHPLWVILGADLAATTVIFVSSLLVNNSSMYDPYWSVGPMVIVLYLLLSQSNASLDLFDWAMLILVNLWAIRLTFNCMRRWTDLSHEDFRYQDIKDKTGIMYWVVSFLGIHVMPTLWVYLAITPLYPAMIDPVNGFGWLAWVGAALTFGAILIETIADEQLYAYLQTKRKPEDFLQTGVWAYSRHPNYFGELSFWWGIFLLGYAANPAYLWTIAGAIGITILFGFISVGMMDRRMLKKRPHYKEYMQRVSPIIPWFPKKG